METQKGFIKYFVIIAIILAVVFLSQQAYSRGIGKTLISDATSKANAYMVEAANWATSNVYSKVTGEVQNRGDIINAAVNQGVDQEKNSVANIGTNLQNYISGITNSIEGKNNSCATQPATPATSGQ